MQHLAAPGAATFARLTRRSGEYWLAIVRGEFVQFDAATNAELMRQTTPEWPHAFTKLYCTPAEFLGTYASNHIHAVYGDWVTELEHVARMLGIQTHLFGEDDAPGF